MPIESSSQLGEGYDDFHEDRMKQFDRDAEFHLLRWIGMTTPLVNYQHDPTRVIGPPIGASLKSPEECKRELDELIAKQAKIDEEVAENRKTIEKIQNINSVISQLDKIIEKYSK